VTWFDRWLLAYDTYVWVPFCWWLVKHPVIGSLMLANAVGGVVWAFTERW